MSMKETIVQSWGNLLEYQEYYDSDGSFLSVGNATFKQDFGPWKQGENIKCLTIDYLRGYIEECDDECKVVKKCAIKVIIDNDRKPSVRKDDDE